MRKTTHEEFVNKVYILTEEDYAVLGQYITNKIKIRMRHNICLHEWEIKPNNFLNGQRCPICSKKNADDKHRRSIQDIKNEVAEITNHEYIVLSKEYKNNKDKVIFEHKACGNIFKATVNNFISKGSRCPVCSFEESYNKKRKGIEKLKVEVFELVKNEYTILSEEYKNLMTKISMRHNLCGTIYDVTPANFVHNGSRCPSCAESKGEQRIRKWLEEKDVYFRTQHTFDGLYSLKKNHLRFDFAIMNDSNEVKILIEYDGIFHYEKRYDGDDHEITKFHDGLKNKYCKNHNIKLLRIPYWDFDNIEIILENNIDNNDDIVPSLNRNILEGVTTKTYLLSY